MSAKRLFLLVLVGAALLATHRTYGEPTGLEAEVGSTVAEVTRAESLRMRLGRLGAAVAGPLVRSILLDTQRLVADLEPAIERARLREKERARRVTTEIERLEGTAHDHLAAGEPISALRTAGRARSLVAGVRQAVAEETAFR